MKFCRIILDFDDTLFDDDRFMSDIFVVFNRYGVSRDVFKTTYQRSKENGWDPIRQAGLIFSKVPSGFIDDIERIFSYSNKYIFDDVLAFLQDNPSSKSILSFGDKLTQLKKIENSGIVSHLDSVHITADHSKKDFFSNISKDSSRLIFIDDKFHVIDAIKTNFPDVFCVLIRRGIGLTDKIDTNADAVISTFEGASFS